IRRQWLKYFLRCTGDKEEKRRPTKVFAKAGLDVVTSTICRHQQRFGLDVQFSALVLNFNNIFSMGSCTRQTSNQSSAFAKDSNVIRYPPTTLFTQSKPYICTAE